MTEFVPCEPLIERALRGDTSALKRLGVTVPYSSIPRWRRQLQRRIAPHHYALWLQRRVLKVLDA